MGLKIENIKEFLTEQCHQILSSSGIDVFSLKSYVLKSYVNFWNLEFGI